MTPMMAITSDRNARRELADQLARHNEVAFEKDGLPIRVAVPDEVTFSLEIEVGDERVGRVGGPWVVASR